MLYHDEAPAGMTLSATRMIFLGARASCSPPLALAEDDPDGGRPYPDEQVRRPWRWRASASKMLALPGGVVTQSISPTKWALGRLGAWILRFKTARTGEAA